MEKEARIIFAQVDHASGEVTGFAVGKIMELGAYNVQLIPTITKKNRPGNIIIIDVDAEHEERIADFLARELHISGYHRINTSHIFRKVTFVEKTVHFYINGHSLPLLCRFKVVGDESAPLSIEVEHDFLVEAQKVLHRSSESYLSLEELRNKIETSYNASSDEIKIEI